MDFWYGFTYELYNDLDEQVYIGSSTTTETQRFSEHKSSSKEGKYKIYIKMREQGIEHWNIRIISEYLIKNRDLLRIEEQKEIDKIPEELKLNELRAYRSEEQQKEYKKEYQKEYQKEYRDTNKEYIKERDKKYYEENKEKLNKKSKKYYDKNKEILKKKAREKVQCICGDIISKGCLLRHMKTQIHLTNMENIKED
jgi:DNA repair photolyase